MLEAGRQIIAGPAGELEVLLELPGNHQSGDPVAVICHPHPLHGGTMDNKVVHMVAKAFNELGVVAARFNFRGVGRSQGSFDKGLGESQDLLAVVEWLRSYYPDSPLWLAGFSFGSFVALRTHELAMAERLLLIAPPVAMFDFTQLDTPVIPWMVIQGGEDEVVSAEEVRLWVESHAFAPALHWFDDAGHFFHGRLIPLREAIKQGWGGW